mmetsp:Transcript_511/g.1098  ORF Transcript_511/g.1098 Transcript_511/m.1098 type:complete len:234 (-) Transcript_511:74-775(-)
MFRLAVLSRYTPTAVATQAAVTSRSTLRAGALQARSTACTTERGRGASSGSDPDALARSSRTSWYALSTSLTAPPNNAVTKDTDLGSSAWCSRAATSVGPCALHVAAIPPVTTEFTVPASSSWASEHRSSRRSCFALSGTCSFGSPDVKKAAKSCDNFAVTRPEVANASAQSPNAFVSCFPRSLRARQTPVATIAAPVNNSLRLFPESDMLRNFNTLAQWHEIRRRVCATIET